MPLKIFQSGTVSITDYLMAAVFFGMGLLLSYFFGKVGVLSCVRLEDRPDCVLETSWMGLVPLKQTSLASLDGANVEENCDSDGCTYRVVIQTATGAIPLEDTYSSGQQPKQNNADQVNAFVQDTSLKNLRVSQGGGFWIIIPLIFVAVGVFLALKPILAAFQSLFPRLDSVN